MTDTEHERLTETIVVLLDALHQCEEYFLDSNGLAPLAPKERQMFKVVRAAMRKAGAR